MLSRLTIWSVRQIGKNYWTQWHALELVTQKSWDLNNNTSLNITSSFLKQPPCYHIHVYIIITDATSCLHWRKSNFLHILCAKQSKCNRVHVSCYHKGYKSFRDSLSFAGTFLGYFPNDVFDDAFSLSPWHLDSYNTIARSESKKSTIANQPMCYST